MFAKFTNPKWFNINLLNKKSIKEISEDVFIDINSNLLKMPQNNIMVSVVIPAYNEELNIIKCIDSLSKQNTKYNFEIIVVNNNSHDKTAEVLEKLNIKKYNQIVKGCGPTRAMGHEKAHGKYILTADADCIYPPTWINTMMKNLISKNTVGVYGNFSFIGDEKKPRIVFFFYEFCRNCIRELRNLKRPFLNAHYLNAGYIKKAGTEIGYDLRNIRGTDGRFFFNLMKKGKIKYIRSTHATTWTGYRTLERDGTIFIAFWNRVLKEILKIDELFKKRADHNTFNSFNESERVHNSIQKLKQIKKNKNN